MALKDDLQTRVNKIFDEAWDTREGRVVPDGAKVPLGNGAVTFDEATILYADLADSTVLVDTHPSWFAAEVYKTYLLCAGKIIESDGGVITAYDGDRVMAVFTSATKNTSAARAALKLNWAVKNIINPKIASRYPEYSYRVKHVVGIDCSKLYVAKTGVWGANDLVWVGKAANHAAKLAALPDAFQSYITHAVYSRLLDQSKLSNGVDMWEKCVWKQMNDMTLYRSKWGWQL